MHAKKVQDTEISPTQNLPWIYESHQQHPDEVVYGEDGHADSLRVQHVIRREWLAYLHPWAQHRIALTDRMGTCLRLYPVCQTRLITSKQGWDVATHFMLGSVFMIKIRVASKMQTSKINDTARAIRLQITSEILHFKNNSSKTWNVGFQTSKRFFHIATVQIQSINHSVQ
jgi:hypothetical protein